MEKISARLPADKETEVHHMVLQQVGLKRISLSEALRDRTSTLHAEAERSGVINDILRKKADLRSYTMLLRNLLPAYSELERTLEIHRNSTVLAVFAQPALRRAKRIEADLTTLCGADWKRDLPLLSAGERYAAAVMAAGEGDGIGLVAHAYVRYFGDLSGGQVLKRLLATSMNLAPQALSFYDFPEIADPKALKDEMRDVIDSQGITSAREEIIVEEGMRAFKLNIEVSNAVQALANASV